MKIVKIKMNNFRGFPGEKEISFDGVPFVLLSSPNGSGKTSVIDAIEWCLTGNIGRLKEAYDNRSTNNAERKKNWDGILKNKNAGEKEYVEVELTYTDKDKTFILLRKQKNDDLNSENSEVVLNGDSISADIELKKIVNKSFYNYHFCDVQKSFGIQSKQRKDLPELFTEFITDYSKEIAVAHNLEVFASDVEKDKFDLDKKRIDDSEIKNLQGKIDGFIKKPEIIPYPNEILYKGEIVDIGLMDEAMLNEQLNQLYLCGYSVSESYLTKVIDDQRYHDIISKLEELKKFLGKNQKDIDLALKNNLHKNNSVIESISNKIQKYRSIHLDRNNIRENAQLLIGLEYENFTSDYFETTIKNIDQKERILSELKNDIKHMTEGNAILSTFIQLFSQKESVIKYQQESEKCPICGSEQFGKLDADQILSETKRYIDSNNGLVARKNIEIIGIRQTIQDMYKRLLELANQVLNNAIEDQEFKKNQLEEIRNKTIPFFTLVNQIKAIKGMGSEAGELESIDYIQNKINILNNQLLSEEEIIENRKKYRDILNLIGYKFESEEESATVIRVGELSKNCPEIIKFEYSLLVQKINAIISVKNNRDYLNSIETLICYKENNDEIDRKKIQLDDLYNKAIQRSSKIRQLVDNLKREEYNSVGPDLKRYYKKLARIDSLASINIVFEEDHISITDENGKNLVNILSNGQLGVFMLSYFFAGIAKRGMKETFKIYFIDDLTACMDDVNMLSFLDLLKYQMIENKNMEQIFFLTCDDRISRLLRYKLDGCKVKYRVISERELVAI